jgi:hypothetical protein
VNDDDRSRLEESDDDSWIELFPFALMAITVIATVIAIALT